MTDKIIGAARAATVAAPPLGDEAYGRFCTGLARRLAAAWPRIRAANDADVGRAREQGLPDVLVDRLRLTREHLTDLVTLTSTVAGELAELTRRPPGTPIGDWGVRHRVPRPLGVVLMIFEARPTVTVEGALLNVAAGNAVILRGGKEIARTNTELGGVVTAALADAGLPAGLVTVLDDPSRALLRELLRRPDAIDVLIPRGSPSLIDYCHRASTIPVLASGGGVNHLYVHSSADPAQAVAIALDSKLPAPAGCTSLEIALVDRPVADDFVAALLDGARRDGRPLTVRVGDGIRRPETTGSWRVEALGEHDFGREFLDSTIGVVAVDSPDEAVAFIQRYGSGHSEAIAATDAAVTAAFTDRVDAATIVVNGSLRLNDGPTLELGSEIAISTSRLHARGPITLAALVNYCWVVEAHGRLREAS
ncbi:glutamate-5-semialdehyde dehydrogenase [Amycolatopsis vancoresmycina]|uniref:Gamma-glutamyl phosphate reductase n=1 Tax=Amycolatopsis vancoresmycina DSM 44592 TaxID=1292037 RepID=R1GBE2_9PSEU|nr:glutamate-5-semialdehyde dehydrogenase [Amycolatopsis vancoresmycina]EOD68658.1 glutamate-5-semialdehyde dehydrogenase [Amycolatopsis vancoresmycina DSM 44592]